MKNIIKRILAFFLVVYLVIVPPFAYAASAGGWSFSAFDVATSVVTALKGGASASVAVAKSPISTKIAKGIAGGVIVGAAIPLAISQISGIALTAVDWMLDAENNQIKYKKPSVYSDTACETYKLSSVYSSPAATCSALAKYYGKDSAISVQTGRNDVYAFYDCKAGAEVLGSATCKAGALTDNWGTIPIPTIADKIYDNAKTDTASASIVNDAVKDYVNSGAADVALDAAKAETDATHGCGTGTSWNGSACVATPDTPTDTPFDPTDIIDAIGKVFDAVMSLPDVINNALDDLLVDIKDFFQPVIDLVTDFFQWFKDTAIDWKDAFVNEYQTVKDKVDHYFNDEPVMTDTPLPESNPTLKDPSEFDKDYIKVTAQCPDDVERQIPVGSMSFTLLFPMSPLCDFLSTYARPVIILMAYITAALSIGNAFRVGG